MTQNIKRQENVAHAMHSQVINLWRKPDFKRLSDEQLATPSLFARLTDIETANYIRGFLRACERETLIPIGLRVTSATKGKNEIEEAQILLGEADGARFVLITNNETRGRFSHFKWEINAYKDFKKVEPKTEHIQRIAQVPERKPPKKKDERINEVPTRYGEVLFHKEFAWVRFGTATYYRARGEIVVDGKTAELQTDVPREFLMALCDARKKESQLWGLVRDAVDVYSGLRMAESESRPNPQEPRKNTGASGNLSYNGGCFEFTCSNGRKCEFNYARSSIAVDDRVVYDHRQIPVEFLQELLGNLDMLPSHAMGVFQATLRKTIKAEVHVAGSELIRWAIRNRWNNPSQA